MTLKYSDLILKSLRCGRESIYTRQDIQQIQSTLVILNSMGPFEILRDIRTSTYQICRIEDKIIRTTTFNKYICNWTLEVRDILKILWKRGEIAPLEQFLLFSTILFYLLLDFHVSAGTRFSLRDKRLFEISEVEITRVNCKRFFCLYFILVISGIFLLP